MRIDAAVSRVENDVKCILIGGDTDSSWNAVRLEPNVREPCQRKDRVSKKEIKEPGTSTFATELLSDCDWIKLFQLLKNQ